MDIITIGFYIFVLILLVCIYGTLVTIANNQVILSEVLSNILRRLH